ncbi:MAG: argininosuccinate lyase [Hydrogenimonas sp.]|nr:MAG: argininosuccinate lyase [Hydrogenimonas sp.]
MQSHDKYYGKGGILKDSAQEILINTAYKYDTQEYDFLLKELNYVDLAYAIMLIEQNIIPENDGKVLLKGLLQVKESIDSGQFDKESILGDIYNLKTAMLEEKIGDIAGWIHIGRARREAINMAFLMHTKKDILDLLRVLTRLIQEIVKKAKESIDVVMPDYTYLQHAQPTRFSHYILTFVYPMLRDIERLLQCYDHFDCSPGGSGSVNGTTLPIDRERLKVLLKFSHIAYHTRDAMWQVDIPIEAASSITMMMTNISRFTEELLIWNSTEFNLVQFPDSLCRASVIMPQKRNPYPLAYIRGIAGKTIGLVSNFASYGKVISGSPDNRIFIYADLPNALKMCNGALTLFTTVIHDMQINDQQMRKYAEDDFIYATDLADYLSYHFSIPYKQSHKVVGKVIRTLIESHAHPSDITVQLLNDALIDIVGHSIDIDDQTLAKIINLDRMLDARKTPGAASQKEVELMIDSIESSLEEYNNKIESKINALNYDDLIELAKKRSQSL